MRIESKEQVSCKEALIAVNNKGNKYEVSQTDKISSYINDEKEKENTKSKVNFLSLFPWFILAFVAMAIVNSTGILPEGFSSMAKTLSKFLMVSSLAAIGMNTSFSDMKKAGFAPMLHGCIISALVVIVALAVEWGMGIV